jgi:hypothetical protein
MNVTMIRKGNEKRSAEREELQAELETIPRKMAEAIERSIRENPDASPFQRGFPAFELRKREAEIRISLANLDLELAARDRHAEREGNKTADKELAAYLQKADALTKDELAGWKEIGEQMVALYRTWITQVVEPAETRDALNTELRATSPIIGGLTPDKQAEVDKAFGTAITPFPMDFVRVLELLLGAAVDPLRRGYRESGGMRTDTERLLPTVVPDIRAEWRTPNLTGRHPFDPTRSQHTSFG